MRTDVLKVPEEDQIGEGHGMVEREEEAAEQEHEL